MVIFPSFSEEGEGDSLLFAAGAILRWQVPFCGKK
jgi:hypothetical protein